MNAIPLATARDVVDCYFTAVMNKNFTAMRALLHDDVSFTGPLGTTDGADACIDSLKQVTAAMTGVERQVPIAGGEEVCQVYDLTLAEPAVTLPAAQWLTAPDERIAMVRLFFDPRPLVSPPPS